MGIFSLEVLGLSPFKYIFLKNKHKYNYTNYTIPIVDISTLSNFVFTQRCADCKHKQ